VNAADGELSVSGERVGAGGEIAIGDTDDVRVESLERTEALVFDMTL